MKVLSTVKHSKNSRIKNKEYVFYGIIIALIVIFLASSIIFKVYQIEILPSQLFGALIGVFITAIVNAFLLRGQTEGDEKREKSVKVFEKKQEVFHDFLHNLKEIIKDGEITISAQGKNADDKNKNVDDLKDLLFQLGYIQMHTSDENANKVFERVSKIILHMNDFNSGDKNKQRSFPKFYANLSEELFGIVAILKSDLYGIETDTISKGKIEDLLRECDLVIDNAEFDKYEMQSYFWDELQKQLKSKGYQFEVTDFKFEVSKYYASARNRHRYLGFGFPVYPAQNIDFYIELEDDYYYGFYSSEMEKENSVQIIQTIQQVSNVFKSNAAWYGYKQPDRHGLNFWTLQSPAFEQLKDARKRKQLVIEIADEMDMYIRKFVELAKQNNL